MITRFSIKNFKALRDVALDLTPMHVLIGPNDTGKTSILQALYAFCRSPFESMDSMFPEDRTDLVWKGSPTNQFSLSAIFSGAGAPLAVYGFACNPSDTTVSVTDEHGRAGDTDITPSKNIGRDSKTVLSRSYGTTEVQVRKTFGQAHYFRWNPRQLSKPVAFDSNRHFRMEETGFGLATCLDDILSYDHARFASIEAAFLRFFPYFERIRLKTERVLSLRAATGNAIGSIPATPLPETEEGKGIYFRLTGSGQDIPASMASDGAMLVLAYLAILNLPEPPSVILVEEPENGIHPQRLSEVLAILRKLVEQGQQTQILMTTHSPYVLDHFKPEEVTLCRRTAQGDVAVKRLSESKRVQEQLDVFTLGEIWTAEGDDAMAK